MKKVFTLLVVGLLLASTDAGFFYIGSVVQANADQAQFNHLVATLKTLLHNSTRDHFPFWDNVTVTVFHNGSLISRSVSPNLITNAGEDVISNCTGRGATGATACTNGGVYIAMTTDSAAPAAGDTTCPTELTTNGLGRALGTWTHTLGTSSHKIANTFTYTGSSAVIIAKVCMFDASSSGNMFAETLLSSTATVNANGDQVTITWTFNH